MIPVTRMAAPAHRRTRRRPRLAHRVRRHERGVEGSAGPAPGDEALEPAGGGQLVVGQEQAHVQLGPGLDLHPAHPPAVHEHGRQSEPAAVLGHHLGRGADVGVEAGAEIGELGAEGGRSDQAGVAPGHQPAGVVAGRVVGPGLGAYLVEGTAAEDRPHPSAEEAEHHGQGGEDGEGHPQGDDQLVLEIGGVRVAQGPRRQSAPEVTEQPGADRHPQEDGHGEGHEEPPGVAAEPAVEGARHDEARQGRGIGQLVHALQPRRVVGRLVGEVVPVVARPRGEAGLGVGRGRTGGDVGRVDVGGGLDPDHPLAVARLHVQVDGPHVLDAGLGQGLDDVGRALGVAADAPGDLHGLVGAPLAEDAAVVHLEEPEEGPGQRRMGVDGAPRRRQRVVAPGQVEEVAGDDEDARSVPRVEGPGEFAGERQGGVCRTGGEQEVADHHDPSAQRDVDPGASRVGQEGVDGRRLGHTQGHPPGRALVLGMGGRRHGPHSLRARRR